MVKPVEIITAKDIMIMLRCSRSTAYRKIGQIKKDLRKPPQGLITAIEFFTYYDLHRFL